MSTIHGFAARELLSNVPRRVLVFCLAMATIVGLGGTLIAEIDYALSFVLPTLGFDTTEHFGLIKTGAQIAILVFTGCYVLWGGYKAVIRTDLLQVPLAYAGFGVVTLSVAWLAIPEGHPSNSLLVAIAVSFLFAVFFLSRWGWIYRPIAASDSNSENHGGFHSSLIKAGLVFGPLIVVGVALALVALVATVRTDHTFLPVTKETTSWLGFGVLGVISLAITNAIWQLIDISSLQRLQSLEFVDTEGAVPDSTRQDVCRGLLASGIEAGGVWVLVIALALAFEAVGVSSLEGLPAFFAGLGGFRILLGPLFIFALITFMISTIDGFISAMAYVSFYDLLGKQSDGEGLNGDRTLGTARATTLLMLFFIYVAYHLLKASLPSEGLIAAVLYAIYAIQITIAPTVLAAFFWPKHLTASAGVASVVVGCSVAVYTAVTGSIWDIPEDSWYVIPPLAALLFSFAAYWLVIGLQRASKAWL